MEDGARLFRGLGSFGSTKPKLGVKEAKNRGEAGVRGRIWHVCAAKAPMTMTTAATGTVALPTGGGAACLV